MARSSCGTCERVCRPCVTVRVRVRVCQCCNTCTTFYACYYTLKLLLMLRMVHLGGPQRDYAHKCPVNDVIIHPNQAELISCDANGSVRIWDLAANACTHELVPEDDVAMRSVSLASDGSMLVAGNNKGNVYVWRMLATSSSQLMAGRNGGVSSSMAHAGAAPGAVPPMADGNLPTSSAHEDDMTWDLQPVTKIHAHGKYLLRNVLSPDVRHLATASADSTVKIWSITSAANASAATSSTSSSSARSSQGTAGIAHTTTFKPERTLSGHQRWVWDCAFSADSEYLVSCASDHTARLWEISTGTTIRQYQGHHKAVTCVALNDLSV